MNDNYQFPAWIAQAGLAVIVGSLVIALAVRSVRRTKRSGMSPGGPLLFLRGVRKSYRGRPVVRGIDLIVAPGEVLGILGPNGAGKTTLMRIATGLVYADGGSVHHPDGPDLAFGAAIARPGVLPHLSGRANLELAWAATGRPDHEAYLAEAIAGGGLTDAELDRRAGDYSQGTAQRLAIALAMLGRPQLLILDEPTNGLDPVQIEHQRDVLTSYAQGGRGVAVSTHLLDEAARMCTRIVVVNDGEVVGELDGPALYAPHESVVETLTSFYRQAVGGTR
ncbi:ABC transporter ATP-binding protein [Demetria terragena]|uniref:ABC transporter ATP-binding protein n=1 Tax=Demetria terragena TaxID=63959 RepID=UPI000368594E|nr:ATP-binding cassette domain-containing protein [Demetria terragena]